jgi:hypothetical protein
LAEHELIGFVPITVKARRSRKSNSSGEARSLIRGRFANRRLPEVEAFTASLPFDRRLYRHDIRGSKAHAQMLAKVGLIKGGELRAIVKGLEQVESEIASGRFKFEIADEDIHLAIERRLIAIIGEPGRKLHTAGLAAISSRRDCRGNRANRRTSRCADSAG